MGRKGRPRGSTTRSGRGGQRRGGRGGLGGLADRALGAAGLGGGQIGAPGMSGTFRVDRFGNITKVSVKRRRKGFRMPAIVREQMRAQNEMTRNLATALLLKAS